MDLSFVTNYFIPIVLLACLIVGYIIKKSLDFISNKYIPAILALLGAVLACVAAQGASLETIVGGAFTGLASTGLHQAFTRIINKNESEEK